jgi:hypothetical protein
LGAFAFNRHLILFGDMLTDDMMASVKEDIISWLTYLGKEEYVSILDKAMKRSLEWNAACEDAQLVCNFLVFLSRLLTGNTGGTTVQAHPTESDEGSLQGP